MKSVSSRAIGQKSFYDVRPPRAAQYLQRSESAFVKSPPRAEQRRLCWLFIFSFLVALVYGGCAKAAEQPEGKVQAKTGDALAPICSVADLP